MPPLPDWAWGWPATDGASWPLLAALVAMAADWVGVARVLPEWTGRRVELVAKPAVPVLLAVAVGLVPTVAPARQAWFVAALAFCLVGDVALLAPRDRFAAFAGGLGAFLVAQVCFAVGLAQGDVDPWAALAAGLAIAAVVAVPALRILGALARAGRAKRLGGPVVLYMGALVAMAATAWAAGFGGARPMERQEWLGAGASLFVVSDTLLALDRFVRPLRRAKLAVHVTYHLAIVALAVSVGSSYLPRSPGSH